MTQRLIRRNWRHSNFLKVGGLVCTQRPLLPSPVSDHFITGHPNLASPIADHWIFWTTGIADYVVIMANRGWLLSLLIMGYALITGGVIVRSARRRSKNAIE